MAPKNLIRASIVEHVDALTLQAERLLFEVLGGANLIPDDVVKEILDQAKPEHRQAWVRWLRYCGGRQGDYNLIKNYCQVASTALVLLNEHHVQRQPLSAVPPTLAPVQSKEEERATTEIEDEVSDRQKSILETMLREEITSHRRRKTRAAIVMLINRTHNPSSYGRDFADLVRRKYVESLEGPSGGMWLDLSRRDEIEQLLTVT
jgi:hypothetical protein